MLKVETTQNTPFWVDILIHHFFPHLSKKTCVRFLLRFQKSLELCCAPFTDEITRGSPVNGGDLTFALIVSGHKSGIRFVCPITENSENPQWPDFPSGHPHRCDRAVPFWRLPLSCWKQEALLSGSRGCLRTPLLGLGLSYSLSGSIACSLSMAGSECGGRDCGNPNIKRDEKKSKAPQSRKPPHQAPIQRGSSGVMSRLPANRKGTV